MNKNKKPNLQFAGADWKDTEGMAESFKEALEKMGKFVYGDPSSEGSDWYGYIISDVELSEKELKKLVWKEFAQV